MYSITSFSRSYTEQPNKKQIVFIAIQKLTTFRDAFSI